MEDDQGTRKAGEAEISLHFPCSFDRSTEIRVARRDADLSRIR